MKVLVVGATGAIGGAILEHTRRCTDITQIIALTRRPLPGVQDGDKNVRNIIIEDFGDLESVAPETWEGLHDADAMVWAMGTYTLDEDVNLKFPLAFQELYAQKRKEWLKSKNEACSKFRFILLSGGFVEPDQSRVLYFLWGQRRMKGLLHTRTLEFAQTHAADWEAYIIRPCVILFGGGSMLNRMTEAVLGTGLAIRSDDLGAYVAHLAANGSPNIVIENLEMVTRGRELLDEAK